MTVYRVYYYYTRQQQSVLGQGERDMAWVCSLLFIPQYNVVYTNTSAFHTLQYTLNHAGHMNKSYSGTSLI